MSTEPEKDFPEKPASATPVTGGLPAGEDFTPPPLAEESGAEIIRKLQADKQQLTDQLLRKQAELENVRKRLLREKDEFLQYSLFQTMEALVPILDGFELALQSDGNGEEYRKGVDLIYQQFAGALQRLGLEVMDTKGHQFNPYLHEAVVTVETDQYEDQQIMEEMQRGYLFKNRLLRPARVKVAQRPAAEPNPPSSDVQPE